MNNSQKATETQIPNPAPKTIYDYPHSISRQDEINLGELLIRLMEQKKLILSIVLIGTILSIAVAFLLPRVYQQEVVLSQPVDADITALNANGYRQYTPIVIFKRYYNYLRSSSKLESYIIDNGYLPKLYPDSRENQKKLLNHFQETFVIDVLEPLPGQEEGLVSMPERISIKTQHNKESTSAELLNGYAKHIEALLLKDISREQEWQIQNELRTINRDMELLRSRAKHDRENLIARIEEENNKRLTDITNQLEALIAKAAAERKDSLIVVKEAYEMAKKLNIEKPTYLSEFSKEAQNTNSTTEINLIDKQELPLYLMGTKYLQARIQQLNSRENDVPFIKTYNTLKEKIRLLENDARLESLKQRKTDDPFIEDLSALQAKKEKLESLSLNFDSVNLYTQEKIAAVTEEPLKPNVKLITILGVLLSVILALLIGLIAIIISVRNIST